LIRFIIYIIKI